MIFHDLLAVFIKERGGSVLELNICTFSPIMCQVFLESNTISCSEFFPYTYILAYGLVIVKEFMPAGAFDVACYHNELSPLHESDYFFNESPN